MVRAPLMAMSIPLATLTSTFCRTSWVSVKSAVVTFSASANPVEPRKSPVRVPPCCSKVMAAKAPLASKALVAPEIVPAFTMSVRTMRLSITIPVPFVDSIVPELLKTLAANSVFPASEESAANRTPSPSLPVMIPTLVKLRVAESPAVSPMLIPTASSVYPVLASITPVAWFRMVTSSAVPVISSTERAEPPVRPKMSPVFVTDVPDWPRMVIAESADEIVPALVTVPPDRPASSPLPWSK